MKLLSVLLLLLLLPSAYALSCSYDHNPYLVDVAPSALCVLNDTANGDCYTYLSNPLNTTEVWGGLPKGEWVDDVGRNDYFKAVNGAVVVEFSKAGLYDNVSVTANVVCGGESESFNFTPQLIDYSRVVEAAGWGLVNSAYVVFFFVVGIIIFISLYLLLKVVK